VQNDRKSEGYFWRNRTDFHFQTLKGHTMKRAKGTKFVTTKELAEMFDVTVQRINQYVNHEGLPKAGRDSFDLREAVNWSKAKILADKAGKKMEEMKSFGTVRFDSEKD
jgi:phage terminase Nu1 subunit (DNA packaging protein)